MAKTANQAAAQPPKSIEVELSDGRKIIVGRLRWAGFRKVKEYLLTQLEGPFGAMLMRILNSLPADFKVDADSLKTLAQAHFVELAMEINRLIDSLWPDLILNCIPPGTVENIDDLDALDLMELRNAALQTARFRDLLELEKNSLAVAVETVKGMFNTKA